MDRRGHPLEAQARAVGLHEAGKFSSEISRIVIGVPLRTIQKWIKYYNEDGYEG